MNSIREYKEPTCYLLGFSLSLFSLFAPDHSFTIRYRMSEKFYLNEKHSPTHCPPVATAHISEYLQYLHTCAYHVFLKLSCNCFMKIYLLFPKLLEDRDNVICCFCSFPSCLAKSWISNRSK